MNVKEYYALRNKDNVYGEMEGVKEAYENRIQDLKWKIEKMCSDRRGCKTKLRQLEKDIPALSLKLEKVKDKFKRVKSQEYINRILLDYDQVIIFQGSEHYHLLLDC